jgi:hypothetical protein
MSQTERLTSTETIGVRLMIHHLKVRSDAMSAAAMIPMTEMTDGAMIPETEITETHAEIAIEIQSRKRRRIARWSQSSRLPVQSQIAMHQCRSCPDQASHLRHLDLEAEEEWLLQQISLQEPRTICSISIRHNLLVGIHLLYQED